MSGKYRVILADPPWSYRDKNANGKRGACFKYPVLDMYALRTLPVSEIAEDDCALFLWTTMPMIPGAIDLMDHWGLPFRTVAFTWVKRTKLGGGWAFGLGHWTRGNAEIVLLGVRGKPRRVSGSVSSLVVSPVREHSRKPDEVRERIVELMGDVPRIELFARPPVVGGWDVWGNEVESSISFGDELKE